jgi:hypothetical protein
MNVPKIHVVKISRPDPITDKPVNFPAFNVGKLHLELLEIKKKLKKNIPAISVRKPEPQIRTENNIESDSDDNSESGDDAMNDFKVSGGNAPIGGGGDGGTGSGNATTTTSVPTLKREKSFVAEKPSSGQQVSSSTPDEDGGSIFGGSEGTIVEYGGVGFADDVGISENREPELSPEEKEKLEQEEKEELIVKFRTLKKAYPQNKDLQLLSYTEHDDLDTMRKMYKRTLGEITFDRKISNYRSYLSVSFMVIEYGFRYLGMNMDGFAKHQAKSIDEYNSLLIELGEKSQGSWIDNFPVEVRLLGLVVFQAVVFWFAKNKNIDISNIINVVSGMVPKEQPPPAGVELQDDSGGGAPVPVKKMKGPSIKPK